AVGGNPLRFARQSPGESRARVGGFGGCGRGNPLDRRVGTRLAPHRARAPALAGPPRAVGRSGRRDRHSSTPSFGLGRTGGGAGGGGGGGGGGRGGRGARPRGANRRCSDARSPAERQTPGRPAGTSRRTP